MNINHEYMEDREEQVFFKYSFTQNENDEIILDQEDLEKIVTENNKKELKEMFNDEILKLLKEGEKSGSDDHEISFVYMNKNIEVKINLDWEVGFGNLSSIRNFGFHDMEMFYFKENKEVNIVLNISSENECHENFNLQDAKEYISSDVIADVEEGKTSGEMNFDLYGVAYDLTWEVR